MKTKLIHIDNLTGICGYFNTDSRIYSGYCCEHADCGDGNFVQKVNGEWEYIGKQIYRREDLIAVRMTSRNIKCNRRLAKKFIKKARILKPNEYPKYGFKIQGGCFAFSCPFAHEADEADEEDFINHGEGPDSMSQGDWLVIDEETLQQLKEKNHGNK